MEKVGSRGPGHTNLRKRHVFLIEKHIEDAKQDEKHVPDLLESIMRPTDPVKEELQQKLFKMTQIDREIKKIRVCTFQMSGKIRDSTNVASEAVISIPFLQYLAPLGAKYIEKTAEKYGF